MRLWVPLAEGDVVSLWMDRRCVVSSLWSWCWVVGWGIYVAGLEEGRSGIGGIVIDGLEGMIWVRGMG